MITMSASDISKFNHATLQHFKPSNNGGFLIIALIIYINKINLQLTYVYCLTYVATNPDNCIFSFWNMDKFASMVRKLQIKSINFSVVLLLSDKNLSSSLLNISLMTSISEYPFSFTILEISVYMALTVPFPSIL